MKTVFLRALEADDKAAALRDAIRDPAAAQGRHRFEVDPASFRAVPRSPLAYWLSYRLRRLFTELPVFETEERTAKQGLATANDFRFVRGWWAASVRPRGERWFPFAKGGKFSPFYSDLPLVVNWAQSGREMKAWADPLYDNSGWSRIIKSTELYFRPGLTWPLRATRFAPHALPAESVFSVRGYCAFVPSNELYWTLAIFSSAIFDYLFKTTLGRYGFPEFIVGVLQGLPWQVPDTEQERSSLHVLARRAWALKRLLDTHTEASHAFALPALLQVSGDTLALRAGAWSEHVRAIESELVAIQAEIDTRCFDLYGIETADRRAITEGFGASNTEDAEREVVEESPGDSDEDAAEASDTDATALAAELISWAVGVAFGRFDVQLATGARALPGEPEPFDPLPICSPGMLTGDDGFPLSAPLTDYPVRFSADGILVDDPGHPRDLTAAVRRVFEFVFDRDADARWLEAAALVDPARHDLRAWLASEYFEFHIKRYSKSRRKAPILWQLAMPSSRYAIWLYVHRLTRDTFFQVQQDLLGPKLALEERKLLSLTQDAGPNPSAGQRKVIAEQAAFVEELRAMRDEVARVAPLWNPDLDDGVVIAMAPLWRLVPQHRVWQRELQSTWEALSAGKYDWSHLAMHLWPERVVPKCAEDRSLAIAHGLEDVFWEEGADGKWKARLAPTRSVDALVRERTSAAVRAALKSLTEAPVPSAGGGRGRGRRATRSGRAGGGQ